MDELYAIAEEHDGLLTSKEARALGIQDSVLVRLAQRGRLERMSRGVYRIAHFPADRLAQYREAVLWAQASQGPERVALSHETALLLYGISDVNPAHVNLTVPMSARLRREHPEWIVIHRANLSPQEISRHEGMPITSVERSVMDVFSTTHRTDIARLAIADALRTGLLTAAQANGLRRRVNHPVYGLSLVEDGSRVKSNKSASTGASWRDRCVGLAREPLRRYQAHWADGVGACPTRV
jgi:predicted transcriptional regulator of viral defense system